jgi:hypothetical protein
MKKKILISVGVLTLLIVLVLSRVNVENLEYVSKYSEKNANDIRADFDEVVVCIFSTDCSGNPRTIPILKNTIEVLKKQNIPYLIIADETYNEGVDAALDQFKKEYSFNETFYLMDRKSYPNNSGIFNVKGRYKSFILDLCKKKEEEFLYGYVNYVIVKNDQYVLQTPLITEKVLMLFEDN